MKILVTTACALAAGLLLVGTVVANRSSQQESGELPPLLDQPQAASIEVVEVQPFRLDEASIHTMRAERPDFDEGVLMVLRAEPERWRLRQSYDNVLYVGAETARRVNAGSGSGHLVVVVPGPVDLEAARVFLGEPELPERVTLAEAQRQVALAAAAGVQPLGDLSRVDRAEMLHAIDEVDLLLHASYLVERYAPDEVDLIEGLRAPRVPRR